MRKLSSLFKVFNRQQKETAQLRAQFELTKDTILVWIYSCERREQLLICIDVIQTHFDAKFHGKINPAAFESASKELVIALKHKDKSFSYKERSAQLSFS